MSSNGPGQGLVTHGADQPISYRLTPPNAATPGGDGGALHQKILGRLNARRQMAQRRLSGRFEAWNEVDDSMRMFVDLNRKAVRGDKTKVPDKVEMPFERSVVIPLSFAIAEVRKTQLLGLFTHQEPPLPIEGNGPEDVSGAKLMEAVIAYDTEQSGYVAVMHSFLQDADRYGIGIIYDVWETEEGWVYPSGPIPQMMRSIGIMPEKIWGPKREYNRWRTVDPYRFYKDPRTSAENIQEGEFAGHRFRRGQSFLQEKKDDKEGPYINVEEALKQAARPGSGARTAMADSDNRFDEDDFVMSASADMSDKGYSTFDHMQVKIVPKDWELGSSTRPEIWWFTTVDESIIVRAHKCPYDHGQFTYALGEVNPDPHVMSNPGMVELLQPINRLVNWLYNSHIENSRKILNDSLIVLPTLIEMGDLLNPGPAKHIRLTAKGEELVIERGMDPMMFARQLQVNDFTQAHLRTAGNIMALGQQLGASNDPAQGQPLEEKRTLGEVQSIIAASSQRLAITAQLIDSTALRPLGRRAISNRQQLTSLQQFFRIAGDLAKVEETAGLQRIQIGRWDLQGNYDYTPHSALIPADPARQAELWIRMLEMGSKIPMLMDPNASPDGWVLDTRKIFNTAAVAAGARNIQEFYRRVNVQVMPDAQVAGQVQAGNMVPAGPPGRPAGGPPDPRAAAMAAAMAQRGGPAPPVVQ